MAIGDISAELHAERPRGVLYHYTSFDGLEGIIGSHSLWATDIHYFSDAAEMRHTTEVLRTEISQRLERGGSNPKLLEQFREWLSHRLTDGHMLFVVSFTANGNLLSQWRAYCPHGKGVSLGFDAGRICQCADRQSFTVAKCVYDSAQQRQLAARVIDSIEALAKERGENTDVSRRHPSQSFHEVFEEVEGDLLRIAAVLKHPSFREEEEWRAVSPVFTNYVEAPISYRKGVAMLLPYLKFSVVQSSGQPMEFQHIYLGPTPNINLSMTSLSRYLAKNRASPKQGIAYCQIPYRQ